MKFIKQKGNDDCLFACICSLMEWDINECPNVENVDDDKFFDLFFEWIHNKGYSICYFKEFPVWGLPEDSIIIASGKSPYRDDCNHAVLWQNGKLLFDPSQKGNKGIIGEPEEYCFLIRIFK